MKESAYKQAGVDIDTATQLIERIKPHVKSTNRPGVMSGIGGFGALFDLKQANMKDPVLVSSTDGVGTKIKIAIDCDMHDTIGIDAVAMCVNDLLVQGAEPLFFLDYFACGKLNNDVAEAVIAGVAEGCRQSNCALIGGETAEMPGLYEVGDYDLAGFTVGAVERDQLITGESIAAGDVILGIASSGLHSNGYSLVRKIVGSTQGYTYDSEAPFAPGKKLKDILLTPTRIYVKPILAALKIKSANGKPAIKGMAHITGGGFLENVPRVLPENTCARIDAKSWNFPPIFAWLREIGGLSTHDLSTTLNCGIGMVVVCDSKFAREIADCLKEHGETVYTLGDITDRKAGGAQVDIINPEAWM